MNIDLRTYTNGIDNIRQHKDLPIPIGYKPGMKKTKYANFTDEQKKEVSKSISDGVRGMLWFTNGSNNLRQTVNDELPLGYYPGRTLKKK